MSDVFGNDRTVTARKKHKCFLCKLAIMPGTKYVTREGIDAGDFWRMKMHVDCRDCGQDMLDCYDWETAWMWTSDEFLEIKNEWIENGKTKPEHKRGRLL